MRLQDYFSNFKVAYDAFIKKASTYGVIDEDTFQMYGRIDYGDIEYSISVKSDNGFELRFYCPITNEGGLNLEEKSLRNTTLRMWWDIEDESRIRKENYDAFKVIKEFVNDSDNLFIYDEGERWVVAEVKVIDPFDDRFLPQVFREVPIDTWEEVDGMRHYETIYEGHYFVVDGKKYNVSCGTRKK